ncbi:MAG TPA: 4-(cytidine 5'-diphospho)-2-C-methyl-D-erythritol kinase [Candidatus Dormibacteraeota bacterium]|nr:4-(cytidine 5'-diphospho)-2-C-methyl-D-erythritol kinase [Candidatus Dormibacteraeota bacterium]
MILAVPARAKINLDLRVVGRRADGFHDLHTTFQAVDLHDLIEIQRATETHFESEGFDIDANENSVLKAHQAAERAAGRQLDVRIHLHKRIPPGSGMGGASSDAAATLKALSTMFKLNLDLDAIAAELGSDVPFFLLGGRARAEGRGERLMPLDSTQQWFALAWPGFELKTADVYAAWDEVNGEGPNELRRAAEHVNSGLVPFAERLGPGWQMTGSGSSFFKSTTSEPEAHDAIKYLDCWTAVTASVTRWG